MAISLETMPNRDENMTCLGSRRMGEGLGFRFALQKRSIQGFSTVLANPVSAMSLAAKD
jgi:hypothetical protein